VEFSLHAIFHVHLCGLIITVVSSAVMSNVPDPKVKERLVVELSSQNLQVCLYLCFTRPRRGTAPVSDFASYEFRVCHMYNLQNPRYGTRQFITDSVASRRQSSAARLFLLSVTVSFLSVFKCMIIRIMTLLCCSVLYTYLYSVDLTFSINLSSDVSEILLFSFFLYIK